MKGSRKKNTKSKKKIERKMRMDLTFLDNHEELAYKNNLWGYRFKYMIIYYLCAFISGNLIWFLNPHGLKNFEGKIILSNLINDAIFISIFFILFWIKKVSHPQIGILLLQIYVCVGYIESSMNFRPSFNQTTYIAVTMLMENMVLIPMIARCNWKFNALASGILNLYFNFRLINSTDNENMKGYPSLVLFGNFFMNSMGCFLAEKYDREIFHEKYRGEQTLQRFESIIREALPTAVIISRKHNILFYNKEAKSLLDFKEKEGLDDLLREVIIEEKSTYDDSEKLKDIKIYGHRESEEESRECLKTEKVTLADILKFNNEKTSLNCFKTYGGKLNKCLDCTKTLYLQIKIGVIIWEGKPALMTIISEDLITQQIRFLKEQAIFKDKLLATVSHDLRTPLNGIIGLIDITLESIIDTEGKRNLQLALRSSKLLQFLINDILDFTQMANGKLHLRPQVFNVLSVIKDVSKLIKFQAKRKGLSFIFQNDSLSASNDALLIRSDPDRLKQVILNLLSNALKFTEQGHLLLKVGIPFPQSSAVKIEVRDTGCGMKPEEIPRLFHLFGKLNNSDNKRLNMTGIGLGLSISQNLVRHLNSFSPGEEIKVTSEVGQGSIFSFTLHPMKEENGEEEEVSNLAREFRYDQNGINPLPKPRSWNVSLVRPQILTERKFKILLVDDDQINILALTAYFNSFQDCEYDTAFNGKQAIDIVERKARGNAFYDIIFMDVNMPIMDGFQASKFILGMVKDNIIPPLAIIATTANSSPTDYQNSFAFGMNDHISKPFTKAQLRAKIDEWGKR